MMQKKSDWYLAWGIFHRGGLVVYDARCPVYWKRAIAKAAAEKRGFTDAEIARVELRRVER
jgi:hypothetical protein